MIASETDVEGPRDVSVATPEMHRERVVVRRRRSRGRRHRSGTWRARASHRRVFRAFAVCAGVLILMAIGLYFGLARQSNSPAETSLAPPAMAAGPALA